MLKSILDGDLHPISMTQMEKTFSEFVLGETFPKPTEVRLEKVKYNAVIYLDLMEGPLDERKKLGNLKLLPLSPTATF